ncbi:MAG: hypothetical protein JW910_05515, partial [Anaerolineae bacterium]|nr:hypothetical protein [Anaerolineae bacterium]
MGVQANYREAIVALRDGQWETAANHLLAVMADAPGYRNASEALVALSQTRPVAYWRAAFTFAMQRGARNHAEAALQRLSEIAPHLEDLSQLRAQVNGTEAPGETSGETPGWHLPPNPIQAIGTELDIDAETDEGETWLDLDAIEAALKTPTPRPAPAHQLESMTGVLEDLEDFDSEFAAPIRWDDTHPLEEFPPAPMEAVSEVEFDTQPLDLPAELPEAEAAALAGQEPLAAWDIDEALAFAQKRSDEVPSRAAPTEDHWSSVESDLPPFSSAEVQYATPESARVAVNAPPALDRMPHPIRRRRDRTLMVLIAVLLVALLGAAMLLDGPLNVNRIADTAAPADVQALIAAVDSQLMQQDP